MPRPILAPGMLPARIPAAAGRRDAGSENPRHDYNSAACCPRSSHTGAMRNTFPRTACPRSRSAWRRGIAHVEFDVQLSADGVPFVIHDASLDRTTRGAGDMRLMMSGQLDGMDAGEPARFGCAHAGTALPRLAAVVELMAELPQARALRRGEAREPRPSRPRALHRADPRGHRAGARALRRDLLRRRRLPPRAHDRARADRLGAGWRPGAAAPGARADAARIRVLRPPAAAGRASACPRAGGPGSPTR